jgi:hypothetical protein
MNLTNLTPEQTLEVLGLVHYAENNTEIQKEMNWKDHYPTLVENFEWIDELQHQYEDAVESNENYIHGVSFADYVLRIERNRQIDALDMINQ